MKTSAGPNRDLLNVPRIFTLRGLKVVLDADLAKLYGVPTKRLNEAVSRNLGRFPEDFCFLVSAEEDASVKEQGANAAGGRIDGLGSQVATLKNRGRGQHRKFRPRVFTEHGALMAANILRSEKAIEMSLYLIRAFVRMREAILSNVTILKRLAEIDRRLVEHDSVLREVIEHLQPLLDAPKVDEAGKPKIGFHRGNR